MALVSGCSGGRGSAGANPPPASDSVPAADITAELQAWADSTLETLSLEQRAGLCLMPAIYASDDPATLAALQRYIADVKTGGVVVLKGDAAGVRAIDSVMTSLSPTPPLIAIDAEWGLAMRIDSTPVFPLNGSLASTADQSLLYEYGAEVARECRLLGINMVLGPVADVAGRGGVIGRRSFGSDPRRVAQLTLAYGRGLEDGNVISVAKHFPGHGSPSIDSHVSLPVISRSREMLDSLDLPPFAACIEGGLSGVMAGHLAAPALGDGLTPAPFSHKILTDLLRDSLGFKGLILTDALNMGGAAGYSAADAIRAGADLILAPQDTHEAQLSIVGAVYDGSLSLEVLADRCRRILFYKALVGRVTDGPHYTSKRPSLADINTPQAAELARRLR